MSDFQLFARGFMAGYIGSNVLWYAKYGEIATQESSMMLGITIGLLLVGARSRPDA